jgi:hypothetical protein
MRHHFDPTLAYSPRTAARAFDPPASTEAIRRAIKLGAHQDNRSRQAPNILRDELIRAAEAGDIQ